MLGSPVVPFGDSRRQLGHMGIWCVWAAHSGRSTLPTHLGSLTLEIFLPIKKAYCFQCCLSQCPSGQMDEISSFIYRHWTSSSMTSIKELYEACEVLQVIQTWEAWSMHHSKKFWQARETANRKPMKFNKLKCQFPYMGRRNLMCWPGTGKQLRRKRPVRPWAQTGRQEIQILLK